MDGIGNLYIADSVNNRIRRVSRAVITTVAGSGTSGYSGDNGLAINAQLFQPIGVAVDAAGNLYIADSVNQRIRKVSNGVITTLAGGGTQLGDNGLATSAQLGVPYGITLDPAGSLYVAGAYIDNFGRIRKVSNRVSSTVAGGGTQLGDSGPATKGQLSSPRAVTLDSVGNLYVADYNNHRIRRIFNGVITTVAGNGTPGYSGDNGSATDAQLQYPHGVAVDSAGNLYIADNGNNRIRKVSNGVITTLAGNGTAGFSGDNGPAINAQMGPLLGIAVDFGGNVYVASGDRVRKVAGGVITTVAGNGTPGFSGDNGPATSAQLAQPYGVTLDSSGTLYIADYNNNRIRKVSNGVITTIAGNGTFGFSGDNGAANNAQLNIPEGVAVDAAGNLYIADYGNHRVRKVSNGIITTVAGNGTPSFSGDNGPATSAQLYNPSGITLDAVGNVYVVDSVNNRIRVLTPSQRSAPTITGVNNAASNLTGPIAPGEIVTITGLGLGPTQLASGHLGNGGLYDSQLAGTSVQVNGVAAPMIYTSGTQVSAIVPYEVSGPTAQVTVIYQGQTSAPTTIALVPSAPALFTLDSTGKGQAAAVNQDGSINTPETPNRIGSVLSLFATGEGLTSPPGVDGKPATPPLPTPNLPVNVTIGGVNVNVLQYVGAAPGQVAGLLQINVPLPAGITAGSAVPVVIRVGEASSQAGVTISVSNN